MSVRVVTVCVELPDMIADLLEMALDESGSVTITPSAIYPGWTGNVVRLDRGVTRVAGKHRAG